MTAYIVPVDAKRADWPRLAANRLNGASKDIAALQAQVSGLFVGLGDYADDTAAAAGGVAVGGLYRNGSHLMIRVA